MRYLWFTSLGLVMAGCLVGPNYRPPLTVTPEVWNESVCQETVCLEDEDFFQWWKSFDDELLNELLCEAAHYNFDLQIAVENICQARGQFDIQTGKLLPQIDFDSIVTRTRNSEAIDGQRLLGPPFQNFFLVGFDAIWEIDFFGRLRRNRKAAFDSWEATVEDARNVQIAVLSEVARNYVFIRGQQKKVDIANQIIQADLAQLTLAEDRLQAGLGSCIDVENSRAVVDADWATLDLLESSLQQSIYAMGVLVGQTPECVAERLSAIAPIPEGNGKIPSGIPSDLLRRRHDIKSAERNLASATELIGAAIAELFPKVSLTSTNLFGARSQSSNFGWASSQAKNLFKEFSKTWSIGPAVFLPLLDFGQRLANIDVQSSVRKQALLKYEKTVITAFQEVEQALVAYFKEEERLHFLNSQVEAVQKTYQYTYALQQSGLGDCTQTWQAQRNLLIAESQLADSEFTLTTNLIALYKALGGDWECFYSP